MWQDSEKRKNILNLATMLPQNVWNTLKQSETIVRKYFNKNNDICQYLKGFRDFMKLYRNIFYSWSWWGSNPRPPECHSDALPTALQPQI